MQSSSVLTTSAISKGGVGAIVLAAGDGKRMQSPLAKVAHTILGKPIIYWCIEALVKTGIQKIVVVLSPKQTHVAEMVRAFPKNKETSLEVAFQETPLGTAHAVSSGLPTLKKMFSGAADPTVVVALGDMPAISNDTYLSYLKAHDTASNAATVMGFVAQDPTGYGRIILDKNSRFAEIREHKDCDDEQLRITLCNSGFMCAQLKVFESLLPQIRNENRAGEYYLTDLPALALKEKRSVGTYTVTTPLELEGVNSQQQLAGVSQYMQRRVIQNWMAKGVQFLNPDLVYVEDSVTFEPGTVVEPFVFLAGATHFRSGERVVAHTRWIDGKRNTNKN